MRGRALLVIGALFCVLAAFMPGAVRAQSATEPLAMSGTLRAGQAGEVPYSAIRPAKWNGTLIVDLDFIEWNQAQRQWFLDRGYAIGGTRRNQNESAYNIREIVDNLLEVRRLLTDRAGAAPRRTIAFGVSRGAIVGRSAIDLHPEIFNAAVVFSGGGAGVVGYLQTKLDAMFALKTLVDPASPMALVHVPRPKAGGAQESAYAAMMEKAKSTPQGRARLVLAAAFDQQPRWSMRQSEKPAPDDFDAQATHMIAGLNPNQGPRWQVEVLNGGNVSWNHSVDYRAALDRSGVADVVRDQYRKAGLNLDADLETLAKAPRISADPEAVARAERNVSYTGKIRGPVLSVKTVGDPADPPATDTAYSQTLERAGTRDLLRNVYVERPGHATMSLLEKIAGFQAIVDRLDRGTWDDEAALPATLNALSEKLAHESQADLGTSRFVLYKPAQALRTWDFTNFGTYRPPATR